MSLRTLLSIGRVNKARQYRLSAINNLKRASLSWRTHYSVNIKPGYLHQLNSILLFHLTGLSKTLTILSDKVFLPGFSRRVLHWAINLTCLYTSQHALNFMIIFLTKGISCPVTRYFSMFRPKIKFEQVFLPPCLTWS